MKALILAAGEGKRLRPFTELMPKPLIPFLGKPLLSYSLDYLKPLNITELLINSFHLNKILEHGVQQLLKSPDYSRYKFQIKKEPFLLGMGGTVLNFKNELQNDERFIILNSDEVSLFKNSNTLTEFVSYHAKSEALATLLVTEHPQVGHQFGGAWCNEKNEVRLFSKKAPQESLKGYHFIGIIICNRRIFNFLKDPLKDINLLYETLTEAISKNENVNVFPVDVQWFETGNPTDFIAATKFVLELIGRERDLTIQNQSHWYKELISAIKNKKPHFMIEDEVLKEKILNLYQL
jgi:mannose-1-phosphate guanylyltransferase